MTGPPLDEAERVPGADGRHTQGPKRAIMRPLGPERCDEGHTAWPRPVFL
jgi:hypothetical protein